MAWCSSGIQLDVLGYGMISDREIDGNVFSWGLYRKRMGDVP